MVPSIGGESTLSGDVARLLLGNRKCVIDCLRKVVVLSENDGHIERLVQCSADEIKAEPQINTLFSELNMLALVIHHSA